MRREEIYLLAAPVLSPEARHPVVGSRRPGRGAVRGGLDSRLAARSAALVAVAGCILGGVRATQVIWTPSWSPVCLGVIWQQRAGFDRLLSVLPPVKIVRPPAHPRCEQTARVLLQGNRRETPRRCLLLVSPLVVLVQQQDIAAVIVWLLCIPPGVPHRLLPYRCAGSAHHLGPDNKWSWPWHRGHHSCQRRWT